MSNWWENPRLADPETRRQDWEAGGRYDPTGSGGGAPVAPVAPAAPSGGGGDNGGGGGQTAPPAPTWDTEKDKPTDSGYTVAQLFALQYPYGDIRKIWEQQNAAAGAPPAPPPAPQNLAPAAPTWRGVAPHTTAPPAMGAQAPIAPTSTQPQGVGTIWGVDSKAGTAGGATATAPAAPQAGAANSAPAPGLVYDADPITGTLGWYKPEYIAQKKQEAADIAAFNKAKAEDEKARAWKGLDIQAANQEAEAKYKEALIAGQAAAQAETARANAFREAIDRQVAAIQQSNAANTAAYQQGLIQNQAATAANQQGLIQQTRRQRRPNRPPRISVAS